LLNSECISLILLALFAISIHVHVFAFVDDKVVPLDPLRQTNLVQPAQHMQ
jgi:hypothetical protein